MGVDNEIGQTTPGDPHQGGTWTDWSLDSSGRWTWTQKSGSRPKSGGHFAWGVDPRTGQRTRHIVYGGTGARHQSNSDTHSKTAAKHHRTRPPYYKRERYFDAGSNKWRWRWRYIATNAEVEARRSGLKHDSRGYYRVVHGRRVYVTGHTASGRRFHMENGVRHWDDPARWPSQVAARRRSLQKRRDELKSRLESLRDQYKKARAEGHLVPRNIVKRMRQVERQLDRVNDALGRLPTNKPFLLDFSKQKPKFKGGLDVTLDVAIKPKDKSPLAFSDKTRVKRNQWVFVRATITFQDRQWRPGLLGAPEVLRVKWNYPGNWLVLDNLASDGTDEYIVSNPLYLIRVFRSPGSGDSTPRFTCRAQIYEFSFDDFRGAHTEGRL